MKIKRFEDLEAWQIARELTNQIYAITKKEFIARDFGFVDQIRKAAISTMNNVSEGFERGSNKDFAKFLFIARGSAGEVRSMLYIALDQQYVATETFNHCYDICVRCSQLCWASSNIFRNIVTGKHEYQFQLSFSSVLYYLHFDPNKTGDFQRL